MLLRAFAPLVRHVPAGRAGRSGDDTCGAQASAQLAGSRQHAFDGGETTIAAIWTTCSKTIEFVKTATTAQIDGTGDKEIVLKFGTREMKFTGQDFLIGFTLGNFFFHYTTAYNILRFIGLEVGKHDFIGTA